MEAAGNGASHVDAEREYRARGNRDNNWLIDRERQRRVNFTGILGINAQDRAVQESMGRVSPLDPVQESGDALLFRRESISEAVFRRLRTAQFRVDGEIDLHGLVAADVEPALRAFLSDALRQDARVVRVVHGKGRRSGNRGPILKLVASRYLQRVGAVLAFASAREVDGGSGAILVLLADRRPRSKATRRD